MTTAFLPPHPALRTVRSPTTTAGARVLLLVLALLLPSIAHATPSVSCAAATDTSVSVTLHNCDSTYGANFCKVVMDGVTYSSYGSGGSGTFTKTFSSLAAHSPPAGFQAWRKTDFYVTDIGETVGAEVDCAVATTPAVPAPTCGPVTQTSLQVSWPAVDSGGVGVGVDYVVDVQGVGEQPTTASLSDVVGGLTGNTNYNVRVRSENAWYQSAWSGYIVCKTAPMVPDQPAKPLPCTGVTSTSMTAVWSAPSGNGAPVSAYRLYIDGVSEADTGSTSESVTGLAPATTYAVTVLATNSVGHSPISVARSCTTANDVPVAPPAPSCTAASTTATTAVFSFSPTSNDNGAAVTDYEADLDGSNAGQSIGMGASYSWTGLTAGSTHTFRVRAVNSVGASAWSSGVACTTDDVPAAPAQPTCGGTTYTSATFSWTTPASNGSPVIDFEADRDGTSIGTTGSNSMTATGLTTSTAYDFRTRARNAVGYGPWSTARSCTPQPQPPVSTAPSCGTASAGSQPLSWSAPNNRGAAIFEYDVIVNGAVDMTVTGTSATVTGLTFYTSYDYAIVARNSAGDSAPVVQSCTTSATTPNVPTSFGCSVVDKFALDLGWTASTVANGPAATQYEVYRLTPGPTTLLSSTPGTAYSHTGLVPATEYEYHVRAENAHGFSAYTSALSCTTDPADIGSIHFTTQPVGNVLYGTPLSTLPVLEIRDDNGDRIVAGPNAGASVTLALASGAGSLAGTTVVSASAGVASGFSGLAGTAGGAAMTLMATVSGASVTSTTFVLYEQASAVIFATQPVHTQLAGDVFSTPPVVHVLDVNGNVIANGPHASLDVTLSAQTVGASLLGAPSTVTASNGIASFSTALRITLTSSTTSHTLRAQTGAPALSVDSAAITVYPVADHAIVSVEPVGNVLEFDLLATMPELVIKDSFGATVTIGPHASPTASATLQNGPGALSGTTTGTCSAGVCSHFAGLSVAGSDPGYTLRFSFSAPVAAVDSAPFAVYGRLALLAFAVLPVGNVVTDASLSTAPRVELLDAGGSRIVSGPHAVLVVTVDMVSGPGAMVAGTTTRTASAGITTNFAGLQFDRRGAYQIEASVAAPATSVVSAPFTIFPRAAELVFNVDPIGETLPGATFDQAPVVHILDVYGVVCDIGPHSELVVTVTPDLATASGGNVVTASAGEAAFLALGIDRGGLFVLHATTLSPPLSIDSIPTIIYGVATSVRFCGHPIGNVLPDETLTTAPSVCIMDTENAIVEYGPDATLPVDLSISGGDERAQLDGVVSRVTAMGVVDFPGLSISWNGTYVMHADSPSLTSGLSNDVVIDIPSNLPPTIVLPSGPHAPEEDSVIDLFINATDPDANRGYDTFHLLITRTFVDNPSSPTAGVDTPEPCMQLGGSGEGLSFATGDATGCHAVLDFSGKAVDVNAALNDFELDTGLDWHGTVDVLVTLDDMGNTGVGGVLVSAGTIPVSFMAKNDAPVLDAADVAAWTVAGADLVEDTPLDLPALRVSDVDSPTGVSSLELSIDVASGGLLIDFELPPGSRVPASSSHSVVGRNANEINALLTTVRVVSAQDVVGTHDVTIAVSDTGDFGSGTVGTDMVTVSMSIAPVNDAPTWTVAGFGSGTNTTWNATLAFEEHVTLAVPTQLVDVDAYESTDQLSVTIWTEGGHVTVTPTASAAATSGDGAASPLLISGATADVAAAVSTLTLSGLDDFNGAETLHLFASDDGATGLGGPKNVSLALPIVIHPIPTIDEVPIRSASIGSRISITGNDFGTGADPVILVTVDGIECATPVRVSEMLITCVAPPGAGAGHVLDLSVDGVPVSNPNIPIVQYAEPIDVVVGDPVLRIVNTGNYTVDAYIFVNTTEPVSRIKVSAPKSALYSLTPFVELTQDPTRPSTEYFGRLRFRPSKTVTGRDLVKFQVEYSGSWKLMTPAITRTFDIIPYPSPRIDSIVPATVPRCGGRVTIIGDYFGPLQGNLTNVTVAGAPCSASAFSSASQVLCVLGPSVQTGAVHIATDSGSDTSASNVTVIERPVITSIVPSSFPALRPTRVQFRGIRLGTSQADVRGITFHAADSAGEPLELRCTDLVRHNASFVECTTPSSTSVATAARAVISTSSGCTNAEETARTVRFVRPTYDAISPSTVSLFGDAVLTVFGSGFRDAGSAQVLLGPRNCTILSISSDSLLTCSVSALPMDLSPVAVKAAQQFSAQVVLSTELGGVAPERGNFSFVLPRPVIDSVTPLQAYANRRKVITIDGSGFGRRPEDVYAVRLGDYNCTTIAASADVQVSIWRSPFTIECQSPLVDDLETDVRGQVVVETAYGTAEFSASSFLLREPVDETVGYEPYAASVMPRQAPLSETTMLDVAGSFRADYGPSIHVVTVGGVPCTVRNVTASLIRCELEPGTEPGTFSVLVATTFGAEGVSTAIFTFLEPEPILEDCYPRIGARTGENAVVLVGKFFGSSADTLAATAADVGCKSVSRLSSTQVMCILPEYDAIGRDSDLPFSVSTPAGASEPFDCGFRFVDDSRICDPYCGRREECIDAQCVCQPGWTGQGCLERNVEARILDDVPVVSEDADSDELLVSVWLNDVPAARVDVSLVDVTRGGTQVHIAPESVSFAAGTALQTPLVFTVVGLDDGERDGIRAADMAFQITSDDPNFDTSYDIPHVVVAVVDRSPTVYDIEPTLLPRIGHNVSIVAADIDVEVEFLLDGVTPVRIVSRAVVGMESERGNKPLSKPRVGDGLIESASQVVSRTKKSSTASEARRVRSTPGVGANVNAESAARLRQDAQRDDGNLEAFVLDFGEAETGYHELTVRNVGRTESEVLDVLYFTSSCRKEGFYGPDCKKCPEGGICPGGDRVWAQPGYWVADESTGIVGQCQYEFRCPGGTGKDCAVGYAGDVCESCAAGYSVSAAGYCKVCPSQGGIIGYIVADIILWSALGLAASLVRDRELFTYCVIAVRAVQTLAGIGDTATTKTPQSVRDVYDVLKLFSGDYSIIKADCFSPLPFHVQYFMAIGHSVAIALPMFLFLYITRTLKLRKLRKAEAHPIEIREESHYFHDRTVRCILVALTLTYLVVGTRSLEALWCVPIGDELYVASSRGTACFEGMHMYVAVVSGVLLFVHILGLPLGVLYWIRRNPKGLYTNTRFMERWNFFYMQLSEGKHNLFLVEFYIFLSLICAKALLPNDPMYQNTLISSGFALKLIIVAILQPFILGSDNTIQALVSALALYATNYNFLVDLGLIDKLEAISPVLVYGLFTFVGCIFIGLVILICVQMRREAILLAAREKGMAFDLGDDWMVSDADRATFAYSFDTSNKADGGLDSKHFDGILPTAAALRPGDEVEAEMARAREEADAAKDDAQFTNSFLRKFANAIPFFGSLGSKESDVQATQRPRANSDYVAPQAGDYYRQENDVALEAWRADHAARLRSLHSRLSPGQVRRDSSASDEHDGTFAVSALMRSFFGEDKHESGESELSLASAALSDADDDDVVSTTSDSLTEDDLSAFSSAQH